MVYIRIIFNLKLVDGNKQRELNFEELDDDDYRLLSVLFQSRNEDVVITCIYLLFKAQR